MLCGLQVIYESMTFYQWYGHPLMGRSCCHLVTMFHTNEARIKNNQVLWQILNRKRRTMQLVSLIPILSLWVRCKYKMLKNCCCTLAIVLYTNNNIKLGSKRSRQNVCLYQKPDKTIQIVSRISILHIVANKANQSRQFNVLSYFRYSIKLKWDI